MLLHWDLVQHSLSGSALIALFSNLLGEELYENASFSVCSFLEDMLLTYSVLVTYPIALALEKLCDAFDESVQRMIVPLLGIIYAERYITVGSLDLSQCNESIQSTLLDSLTVSFNHCSLFSFRHSKRITMARLYSTFCS